jgi:hypothetical protein
LGADLDDDALQRARQLAGLVGHELPKVMILKPSLSVSENGVSSVPGVLVFDRHPWLPNGSPTPSGRLKKTVCFQRLEKMLVKPPFTGRRLIAG